MKTAYRFFIAKHKPMMYKTTLLLLLATSTTITASAQALPEVKPGFASAAKNFVKPPAIGDVAKTTAGIVSELAGKLKLGPKEKPQLTDAIGAFLGRKKDLLPLAASNPAGYLSKFNPLQKDLFGKLKGIMGAAKFAKFMGLKPANAAGVLSNLFF